MILGSTYTLSKKKCNIQKNFKICISCRWISTISWKSQEDVYSDLWVHWKNHLIFFNGVPCLLLRGGFLLEDMTQGYWPWSRVSRKENKEIIAAFHLGKSVWLDNNTFCDTSNVHNHQFAHPLKSASISTFTLFHVSIEITQCCPSSSSSPSSWTWQGFCPLIFL